MTTGAIKAIPIQSIVDKDCGLFIWATHTSIPDALEVIKAWGFKYFGIITWDKMGQGRPCWGFKRDTEFLIYAYKGKITLRQRGDFIHTIIREPVEKHSQKPKIVYTIIEQHAPGPYLEMFSRSTRTGWHAIGDAVTGQDINQSIREGNFVYTKPNKWRV
jgi:N6-adenosine-specific RNA methylase IME4